MRARLADQAARDRILTDLGTNLLVEAGAGSGKTTALVGRMLSLVRSGVRVERMAAVTFTRKAAGELSRKFRETLEAELRRAGGAEATEEARRVDRALRDIDRGFVGTIHAFCARLLRERPLAAGVDPRFREVSGIEERRLQDEFWARWLDERHAAEDPILVRLREAGLAPQELREPFRRLVELSDVQFPADAAALPPLERLHEELGTLLERACERIPLESLEGRRDNLQATVARLTFLRNTTDWRRPADLLAAIQTLSENRCKVIQKLWAADPAGKAEAKRLQEDFRGFVIGPVADAGRAWYTHRYAVILEFLLPLREAFEKHRHATGRLTFQDLLTLAARLLREDASARRELGERFRHLLVDEFQDTDPLQAEVCLLLASDPEEGNRWREVRPRAGALFVVGDPKQSIYRFRRADIEIYGLVRDQIARSGGDVLELTCSFRSRPAIGTFVDAVFRRLFPVRATAEQAAFAPIVAQCDDEPGSGVFRYEIQPDRGAKEWIAEADAAAVADWIAGEIDSGRRSAGDFLVVPYRKEVLALYARELERRNVPVTTTGAGLTVDLELRELIVLLEALADPANGVWTLAALTGLFFGLDPAELWRDRAAGRPLSFTLSDHEPRSRVGVALARLREWSDLCRCWPVDAALARIVGEIGLVPLAAGGGMAESRAGSLVHALEAVGVTAAAGNADLRSAIEAIEALRESPDVEAPLRPGRTGAVRVMNLHKAKGLEAAVVVLPYPAGDYAPEPQERIERAGEAAVGWCQFVDARSSRVLGRPADWERRAAIEKGFMRAERARLLYVATTRARDQLVVGESPEHLEKSPWRELTAELREFATFLPIMPRSVPELPEPQLTVEEIGSRLAAVTAARERAAVAAYEVEPATGAGAGEREDADRDELLFRSAGGRGRLWGSVVHRALATLGRGREGASLRSYCRALLLEARREVGPEGEPVELQALVDLLERVRSSQAWIDLTGRYGARWELTLARLEDRPDGPPRLLTGTVDALGMGGRGEPWRVVDWKTDVVDGAGWSLREDHYRRQVDAYCGMVRGLVGMEAEGRVERVISETVSGSSAEDSRRTLQGTPAAESGSGGRAEPV